MLTDLFWEKLKLEMRLLHVVERQPSMKVKLDPLSEDDYGISKEMVIQWSENNMQLYSQILQNGMAEFICNKQYLYSFYRSLNFINKGLTEIDSAATRFSRLTKLNLSQNNIKTLKYLPPKCKQLYLDFNPVEQIQASKGHPLELLSISHSCIDDTLAKVLTLIFSELRCLNLSHNQISKLKEFVTALANLRYIKILVSFSNPISMLPIYYSYMTDHIPLTYFDGKKYVKEEPPKIEEKPIVTEKKQVKQDKKDSKKDNKKVNKVEEMPVEQPQQVKQPPQPVKKELTVADFEKVSIRIKVSNLQFFNGNLFDSSLFPAQTDPLKVQTCYWIKYVLLDETVDLREQIVAFDSATVENDQRRLSLQCSIEKQLKVNKTSLFQFNKGLKIYVIRREPKMTKDPETLELKPQINEGQIQMVEEVLGATHIDFRIFHTIKENVIKYKYRLFEIEAADSPLFVDPFEDQQAFIERKKNHFEEKLKIIQQQALKKAQQEQQLLLSQKKGGKDQKKAADKKATKKDGKEVVSDKPKTQVCTYPTCERLYAVLQEEKMFKGKELLCVEVKLE